jgi:membrane fusion protein (multidrug efflux system)
MRLVLAVLVALAAPLALPQSTGKDPAKTQAAKPPAMPVKATAARLAPAVDEANAVGTLRADESVVVRPEIAGRVAEILFDEGQSVARGAVLVRLDQAELAAVVASSSAQLKWDRQRLERAEDLFRKGFISQQALDDQRTSLARAKAKLAEDEARLAKTEIRAAFPGVVGLRQVSRGAYVAAGTDIARLEKIDQLKLDFRVPEAFVAKLRAGQPLKVAVDAYPEQNFGGAIYALEPAVDEQTRTVLVRARVGNPESKLRPGMFARVVLQLGVREKAIWVPEQAIVPRGQNSFVFRVANGKADLVKVQIGLRKVGEVEITSGLAAGDLVVTDGTLRLFPGMPVMLMGDKPPAAAAPDRKG